MNFTYVKLNVTLHPGLFFWSSEHRSGRDTDLMFLVGDRLRFAFTGQKELSDNRQFIAARQLFQIWQSPIAKCSNRPEKIVGRAEVNGQTGRQHPLSRVLLQAAPKVAPRTPPGRSRVARIRRCANR